LPSYNLISTSVTSYKPHIPGILPCGPCAQLRNKLQSVRLLRSSNWPFWLKLCRRCRINFKGGRRRCASALYLVR
jgi:hypothetical protein